MSIEEKSLSHWLPLDDLLLSVKRKDRVPSLSSICAMSYLHPQVQSAPARQFKRIAPSSCQTLTNICARIFSRGASTRRATNTYLKSVLEKNWEQAKEAIQQGANVVFPITFYKKLLRTNQLESAAFFLAQESQDKFWEFNDALTHKSSNSLYDKDRVYQVMASCLINIFDKLNERQSFSHIEFMDTIVFFLNKSLLHHNYSAAKYILDTAHSNVYPINLLRNDVDEHIAFKTIGFGKANSLKKLQFWIENGLSIDQLEKEDGRNKSLLYSAIVHEDVECVRYLLGSRCSLLIKSDMLPFSGIPLSTAQEKKRKSYSQESQQILNLVKTHSMLDFCEKIEMQKMRAIEKYLESRIPLDPKEYTKANLQNPFSIAEKTYNPAILDRLNRARQQL